MHVTSQINAGVSRGRCVCRINQHFTWYRYYNRFWLVQAALFCDAVSTRGYLAMPSRGPHQKAFANCTYVFCMMFCETMD